MTSYINILFSNEKKVFSNPYIRFENNYERYCTKNCERFEKQNKGGQMFGLQALSPNRVN